MTTFYLIVLFMYWFSVWGTFNLLLLPRRITLIKGGVKSGIFFWLASLLPLSFIIHYLSKYFIILAIIQIVAVFVPLRQLQVYRNLLSDIIFQQSMLYLLFALLGTPETTTHFIFFILAVSLSHLPIFLLKHVKPAGKLIISLALSIAATIIYFAFRNLQSSTSLLISLTIHFSFYLILMQIPQMHKTGIII